MALLSKNLFTDFPIAIKDKKQHDSSFVGNLWLISYFSVFRMQKFVASAHNFTFNFLNHELRWLKKY